MRTARSELAERDFIVARLAAGDDPAAVIPTALGMGARTPAGRPGLSASQSVAVRRTLETFRADLATVSSQIAERERRELTEARHLATDWRERHDAVTARLNEIGASYLSALETVRAQSEEHMRLRMTIATLEADKQELRQRIETLTHGEESWRRLYEATTARLAEVSAQYQAALDTVREKGEAQSAAIASVAEAMRAQGAAEARGG